MIWKKITAVLTAVIMAVFILPVAVHAETSDGLLFRELADGTYEVLRDPAALEPSGVVSIPETINGRRVTRIADGAFAGCEGLSGINIPESVTSVGVNAFTGTAFLEEQDGDVKYAGRAAVWCDPEAENVTVKNGTTALADRLFYLAEDIKTVSLPETLINLGTAAFHGCKELTDVNIPSGIERIPDGAFAECAALARVTLPGGLKGIGAYAFYKSGLQSVSLPDGVEIIGKGAFQGSSATSVDMSGGYVDIGGLAFAGTPFYEKQDALKYAGSVLIGCDKNAVSAEIKYGTAAVADMAFCGCEKLRNVDIPSTVTSIGKDAFFGCGSLGTITVPEGVTSIGENAFRLCGALSEVTLPKSLRVIGKGAFYGCVTLNSVNGSLSNVEIGAENGSLPSVRPEPPAVFICSGRSTDSVSLSWEASCPADMYEIDINRNGKWQMALRTSNTSCDIKELSADTVYEFKIYSFRGDEYSSSAYLRAYTERPSDKPSAVTGAKAVPNAGSVELSWNKNDMADSYEVDVYLNGKWKFLGKTTSCFYTAEGLSPETDYEFKIFAFNGDKYSPSARVKATTLVSADKPSAVTGAKAVPKAGSVELSWNKNDMADSYEVDVYLNGKWTFLGKTTSCSYTAEGLSPETDYEFKIFAFNGGEYSPSARIKTTTLVSANKPSAVTGVKAVPTENSVALSWNKSEKADSYEIDVFKNGRWTFVDKITECSVTVSGLSENTEYEFKIFAFNGEEYSPSARIKATTLRSDRPERVMGTKAVSSANSVTLSWNKSDDADSYEIDIYRNGHWELLTNTTNTTYTADGLSANTTYFFKIFAFKGDKYSRSAGITAETVSKLAPPSDAFSDTFSVMRGIDVSGWQNEIDFKAVKESGIDFVIVKAGTNRKNAAQTVETWEKNYQNAKKCGLLVGAYWYTLADSIEEAQAEAEDFAAALKNKAPDLPVYLDLEETDIFPHGKSYVTNLVNTFCGVLENEGLNAGVYCSTTWFTSYVDEKTRILRPAWIADYRGKCFYEGAYATWQYGTDKISGIDGNCDVNWKFG